MELLEIGQATIVYDTQGKATEASFSPTMKIDLDTGVLMQLTQLNGSNEKTLNDNAGLVLGSWFSKIYDIEMSDRDHYQVVSETVKCDKYSNGNIKSCLVKFIFKKLQP